MSRLAQASARPEESSTRPGTWLLVLALCAAVAFRLYLLVANDFPINDGALFLEFLRATGASFPRLPTEAAFNGIVLPFAYPPLALWLGALLTKLGFDSLNVVRTVPILMNVAYVLLFALLLLKSGRTRLFTALAVLFLSVTLLSFQWLVMGGGLTRGLGALFLMLTLLAVTVPDEARGESPSLGRMAVSGAAVGCAILSHLEWGLLAAGSVVLSRALGSRSIMDFVLQCLVAGATAFALILPWLFFVYQAHGLEPFIAAASTGGWTAKFVLVRLLEVAIVPTLTNPFVLVGGAVLLLKKQWFWIGFIILCAALTPRHAPTPLTLPIAVFAAQGLISAYQFAGRFVRSRNVLAGGAAVVAAALLAYGAYRSTVAAQTYFRTLPAEMREGMAWVARHHSGAPFVIVNDRAWQDDASGEWFPLLAQARSVTTVQGREWNGQHNRWDEMHRALRASVSCDELHSRLSAFGPFDFVWAEKMDECFPSPRFQPVFRNERVRIYRVRNNSPRSGSSGSL